MMEAAEPTARAVLALAEDAAEGAAAPAVGSAGAAEPLGAQVS
jgi:hypothetical protein